uniref:Uncharacterized protein n=1 Tax=Tanacetum cinerariifolium TaxID=118510 RepID=A0A699GTV1_TANCI|nr:hypothetical protein [Tanacetum cinerariifolium]
MFLNVEQLEKKLDKEDFQEIGSMAAFNYTQLAILEFRNILIQHMESVKKSIDEREHYKREYDSWVNERQMQTTKEKVDTSKALDASLVDTESSGADSKEQYTSSRSGNDAHDDADIRPIYDEEPMDEVQTTSEINIFAIGQQHYEQLEFNNEGAKTIEHITSLIATNDNFKAQLQEKGFAIAALKNELRKVTGNSVNTKFAKSSILGKPVLQSQRNQSVVRQPIAFKSERPRISKPRNSSKNMPRFHSNEMVHNHYLEEAKKKTQERDRNSRPSVMPSVRSQSTENGSKPKPRSNNQNFRNWHASKSSCITTKTVPIAEHPRNSWNFSDSKHFVCSTCQICVFNANHDSCLTKLMNEVNHVLRWKPTGKIFKTVGLRWVPTRKIFDSSTIKVDSDPTNGLNADITNQYECKQTLDGFKEFSIDEHAMTSNHNSSELGVHDHSNEQSSSKLVPKVIPPVDKTDTSRQELELLFHHQITMLSHKVVRLGFSPMIQPEPKGSTQGHSIVRNSSP